MNVAVEFHRKSGTAERHPDRAGATGSGSGPVQPHAEKAAGDFGCMERYHLDGHGGAGAGTQGWWTDFRVLQRIGGPRCFVIA